MQLRVVEATPLLRQTASTCERCESAAGEIGGGGGAGGAADGSVLHRELTAEALHCEADQACLPLTCRGKTNSSVMFTKNVRNTKRHTHTH